MSQSAEKLHAGKLIIIDFERNAKSFASPGIRSNDENEWPLVAKQSENAAAVLFEHGVSVSRRDGETIIALSGMITQETTMEGDLKNAKHGDPVLAVPKLTTDPSRPVSAPVCIIAYLKAGTPAPGKRS